MPMPPAAVIASGASAAPPAPGFGAAERARLLLATGIGPGLVRSLELAGFRSIAEMRRLGVPAVLERMSAVLGRPVVANRAQALLRAIGPDLRD